MEKLVHLDDSGSLRDIFGVEDRNLKFLEKELGIKIFSNPKGLVLKGPKAELDEAVKFIEKIIELAKDGFTLSREELKGYLDSNSEKSGQYGIKVSSPRRRLVFPKTDGQIDYLKAMRDYDITFSIGPAGTGKTYLAMAVAVNYLMERKISRIILARPAIEAGESLGFLPGDMSAKLGPYLRPLYDALYDMMEAKTIEDYLESGVIEIAPLAYMRGRTLNNAFVILDEAQNCTSEQLKMFLTRLGFDSKTVITGDVTQSDLPGGRPAGLNEAVKILKTIKGIRFINLTGKDVVRHPLIQKIIKAYEDFNSKKKDRPQ